MKWDYTVYFLVVQWEVLFLKVIYERANLFPYVNYIRNTVCIFLGTFKGRSSFLLYGYFIFTKIEIRVEVQSEVFFNIWMKFMKKIRANWDFSKKTLFVKDGGTEYLILQETDLLLPLYFHYLSSYQSYFNFCCPTNSMVIVLMMEMKWFYA